MSKFKDNFSSESFYPDSNFYAENEKILQRIQFQKIKYLIWEKILNGQIPTGLLRKEQMEGLQ